MAEDEGGELASVDHGPLNEGPWEKGETHSNTEGGQKCPAAVPEYR